MYMKMVRSRAYNKDIYLILNNRSNDINIEKIFLFYCRQYYEFSINEFCLYIDINAIQFYKEY